MQAAALLQRHAFIDIETTGLDPSSDEVIELGLVLVEAGEAYARHQWRFRHRQPLAPMIQALTGLPEMTEPSRPTLAEQWPQIEALLEGHTVVAHNAAFEQSFLKPLQTRPLLDSCELTHFLFPSLRSHSLDALVRWASVGPGARHRALDDAEDTFRVVKVALERSVSRPMPEAIDGPLGPLLCCTQPLTVEAPIEATSRPTPKGLGLLETEVEAFAALCRDYTQSGVDVAVPTFRLGDVPDDVQRSLPASARVCRKKLLRLLELERFSPMARAYVRRWLEQTRHGERATISGWMSERWPDVRLLSVLSMAGPNCDCFVPTVGGSVITHEAAVGSLGQKPVVILDAGRFPPRPTVVEGRRMKELKVLFELAEAPFEDEVAPTAEQIRALRLSQPLEGFERAAEYFAELLTPRPPTEPVDLGPLLKAADVLLVYDVVTQNAGWLTGLGLTELTPERRGAVNSSSIERLTEMPTVLSGVVLGFGAITPQLVGAQVAARPGSVRLGLTSAAPLRLSNWWPGQSLSQLDVTEVGVVGPARPDDLRRLQLALPARVTKIRFFDRPPPPGPPITAEPTASPTRP